MAFSLDPTIRSALSQMNIQLPPALQQQQQQPPVSMDLLMQKVQQLASGWQGLQMGAGPGNRREMFEEQVNRFIDQEHLGKLLQSGPVREAMSSSGLNETEVRGIYRNLARANLANDQNYVRDIETAQEGTPLANVRTIMKAFESGSFEIQKDAAIEEIRKEPDTGTIQTLMSNGRVSAAAQAAGYNMSEVLSLYEEITVSKQLGASPELDKALRAADGTELAAKGNLIRTIENVTKEYQGQRGQQRVQEIMQENPVVGQTFGSREFQQLSERSGMPPGALRSAFMDYLRAQEDPYFANSIQSAATQGDEGAARQLQAGQAVAQLVEQKALEERRRNPQMVAELVAEEMKNPIYQEVLNRDSVKARAEAYGINAADLLRTTLSLRATQDQDYTRGLIQRSSQGDRNAKNQLEFLSHLQQTVDQARNPNTQTPSRPSQARVDRFLARDSVQRRARELGVNPALAYTTMANSAVDDAELFRTRQRAEAGDPQARNLVTMIEFLQYENLQNPA